MRKAEKTEVEKVDLKWEVGMRNVERQKVGSYGTERMGHWEWQYC